MAATSVLRGYDKTEHLRRRLLTYLARRALGDLFTGPYREA